MHCPICPRPDTRVIDSRLISDGSKIRLTFSIRHGAGYHLTETKLAENQIILEEDQEHYRIQAELVDSTMLNWWLAKFGNDIWDIEKVPL